MHKRVSTTRHRRGRRASRDARLPPFFSKGELVMSSTTSTTSPVSIASSSSAGAAGGSVINVSSLVSQLVTATETPQQNLINSQQEANTTQISALGTLKSALSTFQASLSALDTPSAFDTETANTSSTAF